MKTFFLKIVAVTFFILSVSEINAQNSREKFGKSRIQYRDFNWRYYSTPHFDIHFYDGGQSIAKNVAQSIEEEYGRITDIMGYAPYIKTKVFIYNSNIDYNQSNVGLKETKYDIGGQTNFIKTHIEVPFEGNLVQFKQDLSYKISRLFIEDMMFGGIGEVFQSTYLFTLPDWFIYGISAYIAYGWDAQMDDFIRSYFKDNSSDDIKKLQGREAILAGQAFWNFLSERYGRVNISNILNLTRIIRNEEKSITNTLGVPYKAVLNKFYAYYTNSYRDEYERIEKKKRISKPWKKNVDYKTSLSPDGNWLAYSLNKDGKLKVFVRNLNTGKEKKVYTGGVKRLDEENNPDFPALDWGDSATLGIAIYERGINYIKTYNPYNGDTFLRDLRRIDQVNSFDIYPNGKTAILSASINGQSDLYLISIKKPSQRRLTNDLNDDVYPSFIPGTKKIVFSSNRRTDTLNTDADYENLSLDYNLFEYDIDSTQTTLKRITNDFGINTQVTAPDSENLYFLSDRSGIFNLYHMRLSDSLTTQTTAFVTSILDYDIAEPGNIFTYVVKKGNESEMLLERNYQLDVQKFSTSTLRKQVELSRIVSKGKRSRVTPRRTDEDVLKTRNPENVNPFSKNKNTEMNEKPENETSKLNADDFAFEAPIKQNRDKEESSLLKNLKKLRAKPDIMGPLQYEPTFLSDNVVTSWTIDPLIGFSPLFEYQMNDLLENNKFFGGFMITTSDFKSGKIFGEYQHLSQFLDYSIRIERKSLNFELPTTEYINQNFSLNSLSAGIGIPISNTARFEVNPHLVLRTFRESSSSIFNNIQVDRFQNPLSNQLYTGGKLQFIFDNSNPIALNSREGTRLKISLDNYTAFNKNEGFTKLSLDFRNYFNIYRGITFATRVFGGGFFGENSPFFMLGGVDNWLGRRSNDPARNQDDPEKNPLVLTPTTNPNENANIVFHEFITGLRGFRLNEYSGKNAVLISNEIRIPLFRALSNNAITSNFLRNFQIVGFYDFGTAWLGGTPWDQNNSINREVIEATNFEITVQNYKNPWLSSVGAGIRTTLFGYYVKVDYAFPIEDYILQDANLNISLGLDF